MFPPHLHLQCVRTDLSPPLLSPPSSEEGNPESPVRSPLHFEHLDPMNLCHIVKPMFPTMPDVDIRSTFYLRREGEFLIELAFKEVKELILRPANIDLSNSHLIMYRQQDDFEPAHLPQLQDAAHLPIVPWVLLNWALKREGGVEEEVKELIHQLGPWLDPSPFVSNWRKKIMLRQMPIRVTTRSNTNATVVMDVFPRLKQMSLLLSWDGASGIRPQRVTEMIAIAQRNRWIYPPTGEEVWPWEKEKKSARELQLTPPLPYNMNTLFWNARGLARPTFKPNLNLLLSHNKPDILILAETKVPRAQTATIAGSLPFDSWFLVDPIGFAGGILVLWNSARVSISVINQNAQGVHALVEVPSKTPFFLSAIYASPKFINRKLLWDNLRDVAVSVNMPWLLIGDFNDVVCQSEKWGGGLLIKRGLIILKK